MSEGSVLVVGGTRGIGRALAEHYHAAGHSVVLTGRSGDDAAAVAAEIGSNATGIALDLAEPESLAGALSEVGPVSRLALVAIDRDNNPVRDYDIQGALYLTTMKLVGYTATISALLDRLSDDSSVVLFGGRAKDRPYPGSTTVTTVNGGVSSMIRTFAIELAPIRFNAIHPGVVSDSPFWVEKDQSGLVARTPIGRLATMDEIVDATRFLFENGAMNGVNLYIDGGWMLM